MQPLPTPSAPGPSQPQSHRIPDALLEKLHQANAHFHTARLQIEQTMADNEYRHQDRLNKNETDLRQAERDIEQIEKEIEQFLAS